MKTDRLFILGAQKCGTSSLAIALQQTFNTIELSSPKEPMIFSRGDFDCHRTLFADPSVDFFPTDADCIRQFEACFRSDRPIKLDASTSYLLSQRACEAIPRIFPGAMALIVLRDPIERIASAYWHYVRTGLICHDFDRAVELGPSHLVNCGFYAEQVRWAKSAFGMDRVLVASASHVYANQAGFAAAVSGFLGVRQDADLTLGRDNQGYYPLHPSSQLLANYFRQRSGKKFFHRAKSEGRLRTYGILGGIAETVSRFNLRSGQRPLIRTRLLPRLMELYRRENRDIDDLIDFGDSSSWFASYGSYFQT